MGTKGGKRTVAKKTPKTSPKLVAKSAAPTASRTAASKPTVAPKARAAATPKAPASRPATPAPGSARPPAQPTTLQRAERLRDAIQQSKLTAADPWAYTAKARAWVRRAQQLVEGLARDGDTPDLSRALDALTAEVGGDRDYQEAWRRI